MPRRFHSKARLSNSRSRYASPDKERTVHRLDGRYQWCTEESLPDVSSVSVLSSSVLHDDLDRQVGSDKRSVRRRRVEIEEDFTVRIPTSTFQALERFLFHGIPTGGFLRAVMENDLRGSFERADEENRANLFATLCFLVNAMPSIT